MAPKSLENNELKISEIATLEVINGRKYAPSTRLRPRSKVLRKAANGIATRCCGRPEASAI